MTREIVVQDCGCISLPDEVADRLDMGPGARLLLEINEVERRVTLVAVEPYHRQLTARAACPVKT